MSLTSGERRALAWLLALIALGAAVQMTRSWRDAGTATTESSAALRLQLVAVDSAQRADRTRQRSRPTAGGRRRRPRNAPGDAQASEEHARVPTSEATTTPRSTRSIRSAQVTTLAPVDVDQADSALLERLPRIGPALAARIVANRNQHGPFGSLAELQRVRGIGPKLAAGLASIVTFSGIRRPSAVQH